MGDYKPQKDKEGYYIVDGRRVTFTMADGTVLKNLDNFVLPYNKRTALAFDIAERVARETYERQQEG